MPFRNVNTKAPYLSGFLRGINISFTNRRQEWVTGEITKTTKIRVDA